MASSNSSTEKESLKPFVVKIITVAAIAIILYGIVLLITQVLKYSAVNGFLILLLWTVYNVILALIIIYIGVSLYRLRKTLPTWLSTIKVLTATLLIIGFTFALLTPPLSGVLTALSLPPSGTWLTPPFEEQDIFSLNEVLINRTIFVTLYEARARFNGSHVMGQEDRVTLHVLNEDSVSRAFTIDELNVSSGLISPGSSAIIEFIPNRVGSFKAYCPISGILYGYVDVYGVTPISIIKRAAEIVADEVGIKYFMTYFKFKNSFLMTNSMRSVKDDLIDAYHVHFSYWIGIKNFETTVLVEVKIGVDNVSISINRIPNRLKDSTKGMPYNIDQDDAIRIASQILPFGIDGYHTNFYFYGGDLNRYVWCVSTYFTRQEAWEGMGKYVIIDPYSGEVLTGGYFQWMA